MQVSMLTSKPVSPSAVRLSGSDPVDLIRDHLPEVESSGQGYLGRYRVMASARVAAASPNMMEM